MMSRAQSVMWLKQLNGPFPACFSSFSTRTLACSFITSRKSDRIAKWKVGVNIFLRLRHFEPVLIERKVVKCLAFGTNTHLELSGVDKIVTISRLFIFYCCRKT